MSQPQKNVTEPASDASNQSVMHYHVNWSSTGHSPEIFETYVEAHDAAQSVVEGNSPTANNRPQPIANETFSVESFHEDCPVCLKFQGAR